MRSHGTSFWDTAYLACIEAPHGASGPRPPVCSSSGWVAPSLASVTWIRLQETSFSDLHASCHRKAEDVRPIRGKGGPR